MEFVVSGFDMNIPSGYARWEIRVWAGEWSRICRGWGNIKFHAGSTVTSTDRRNERNITQKSSKRKSFRCTFPVDANMKDATNEDTGINWSPVLDATVPFIVERSTRPLIGVDTSSIANFFRNFPSNRKRSRLRKNSRNILWDAFPFRPQRMMSMTSVSSVIQKRRRWTSRIRNAVICLFAIILTSTCPVRTRVIFVSGIIICTRLATGMTRRNTMEIGEIAPNATVFWTVAITIILRYGASNLRIGFRSRPASSDSSHRDRW